MDAVRRPDCLYKDAIREYRLGGRVGGGSEVELFILLRESGQIKG